MEGWQLEGVRLPVREASSRLLRLRYRLADWPAVGFVWELRDRGGVSAVVGAGQV